MQLFTLACALVVRASGDVHIPIVRHNPHNLHVVEHVVDGGVEPTKTSKLASNGQSQEATFGQVRVAGPLPVNFPSTFVTAVSQAEGVPESSVKLLSSRTDPTQNGNVVLLGFQAPRATVLAVEKDAADPASRLAHGSLHTFLEVSTHQASSSTHHASPPSGPAIIDVDTQMPFGELEPFGREDTAQELTEQSVKESDSMVDQLERAEVSEEKRAVFRALTRLRGEAITSFDGIARSQTGNIDEYSKTNKWRQAHPLHHLANEESDVTKWAFPDKADF